MRSLFLLFTLIVSFNSAFAGWENGNAGDTVAAEFIMTARHAVERMKLLPHSELTELDLDKLSGAILNTKVHSREQLFLRGYEVDAINDPESRQIVVNRSRWKLLRVPTETANRLMLVIHEYLYIIGIDDNQFRVSGRLVPLMQIKDFNPSRWWNPLNPMNRISLALEYTPADCRVEGLNFDLSQSEEFVTTTTSGNCGEAFRKVAVRKTSHLAPPASGAKGNFHRFEVEVKDASENTLGMFSFEPSWGECLLPEDGTCQLSGKFRLGGVEFEFWLAR